jgi:hypothetical protein
LAIRKLANKKHQKACFECYFKIHKVKNACLENYLNSIFKKKDYLIILKE